MPFLRISHLLSSFASPIDDLLRFSSTPRHNSFPFHQTRPWQLRLGPQGNPPFQSDHSSWTTWFAPRQLSLSSTLDTIYKFCPYPKRPSNLRAIIGLDISNIRPWIRGTNSKHQPLYKYIVVTNSGHIQCIITLFSFQGFPIQLRCLLCFQLQLHWLLTQT